MKVLNPKHVNAVEQFVSDNKTVIETYLTNNASMAEITFDKIRADFPNVADPKTGTVPMTDGTLAEIFKAIGAEVVSDG